MFWIFLLYGLLSAIILVPLLIAKIKTTNYITNYPKELEKELRRKYEARSHKKDLDCP